MTAEIPFVGLAPDSRSKRGSGELARFDLTAALDLSRTLRKLASGAQQPGGSGAVSSPQVLATVLDAINAFEHDGRPASVLLRAFVSCSLQELGPELQGVVRASAPELAPHANPLCLRLLATRGIEPAWNDVASSAGHGALLLEGNSAPMVMELVRQLRVGDPTAPPAASFYVPEAAASAAIPEKSFVTAYGVRSVFGFGTTVWPREIVVVLGFARVSLERSAARAFETVALYTKAAWFNTLEAHVALEGKNYEQLRAEVQSQIANLHEAQLHDVMADFTTRLDATRAELTRLADTNAHKVESHNAQLRRTQHAMLNVIEDLREARGALESQVASRTRELALANKQLEARNRELEEFVYIASHDLQEPLRTMSGYLQMIQRRYGSKLGVEADEFIAFAVQGAQRMQSLLESLLLYSRVATVETVLELVPLAEPLAVALENLALRVEESGALIEQGPLPQVRANRMQMVQLFQNLLSNAIKFAGDKPPRVVVRSHTEGEWHVVSVRDEGIGFNPQFSERIFKVFRRLKRDTPGTGIGLAICKKIAERHGGHIQAQSAPGAGATFSVQFPNDALAGIQP